MHFLKTVLSQKISLNSLILIWGPLFLAACGGQSQFAALHDVKNSETNTLAILENAYKNDKSNEQLGRPNFLTDDSAQPAAKTDGSATTKPKTETSSESNDSKKTDSKSDAATTADPKKSDSANNDSKKEDSAKTGAQEKKPAPVHESPTVNPFTYLSQKYPYSTYKMTPLSWESEKYPERKNWSRFLQELLVIEWSSLLEGTEDIEKLCPTFYKLSVPQRANVWANIFAIMSYYESTYNPAGRMKESNMGVDNITKSEVYSEGLLQLSYQDMIWAKYCRFNWESDSVLEPTDVKKSIFNPYRNLYCGAGIMAGQIRRTKKIILTTGAYWAVLIEGGRFTKVAEIIKDSNSFELCK